MTGLLRLCRPYYALPISLGFLLTVFYARGGQMTGAWPLASLATAALALMIMAGHVLNDVFDVAVDRINSPTRPIPSGRVSRAAAAAFGSALAAAALLIAWLSCRPFAAVLTGVGGLLVLYNATSKRLGLAKPAVVAALMTTIYPLAFAQAGGVGGPRAGALAVFPVLVFLLTLSYELLKDVRDVAGDRQVARPGPLQRDPALWRGIAHGIGLLAAPLLVGPFLLGCRWVYLAGAGVSFCLILAAVFLPIRHAIVAGYLQVALIGVAAALDVAVLGM